MPPRRSARSSTRDSEPPPDAPPTKRKRVQSKADDSTTIEIAGAIAGTRKPTSTRSNASIANTRNRASTRSKPSLKEVTEIVEVSDGEVSVPPSKKKRLSEQTVVQQEESSDEREEVEPAPKRRGAVVIARSVVGKATRKAKRVESEEEMSEAGESRSVAPLRKDSVVPTRKSSRGSTKLMKTEPESTIISDSDEARPAAKTRKPRVMKMADEGGSDLETTTDRNTTTSRVSRRAVSSQLRQKSLPSVEDPEEASVALSPAEVVSSHSGSHAVHASRSNLDVSLDDPKVELQSEGPALRLIGQDPKALDTEEEHSLLDVSLVSPSRPRPPPPAEEPKGPQARLVIHKMVLVNFKSYAGRQEIGPFHKSFSAIVGPNGSGKSNTIDALLFVFGYRASKMRQGKLSELIHNSARYPDLQDCSVEIHFREINDLPGPDAFDIVPNSQLIVSRTAYKNNNSKYTINGRNSAFKEVQALLKGKDIDLDHNRFLILQGEVEAIALMKPKAPSEHEDGLLEYLEDIIGTSRFKEPLEEAFAEMERLAEDRAEKLNRLRLTEKEKNALLDKKREAEDYLRLQNEHIRALSRLWQWYLFRCFRNEQTFETKASRLQSELDEERDKYKDDVTHQEMLQKHFEERERAYAEIKEAAAEAVKDLAKHEKQQVGLEERLKHSSSKAKKLKKTIQDDERSRSEASRTFESSVTKIEKEKLKVEEYEASLTKEEKVLEEIRDSLKDKTQVFHDQIEVKQKELQPWTAKINAKRSEIDISSSERDALVKKLEAAKAATTEATATLESLRRDQEAKTTELEDLKAQKSNLGNQLGAKQQKLQETRSNVQRLRQQASSARQRADEAKSSQATNRSQNQVLDSLTKLQHSGRISGFHGRLGNLGTIPDKYDVAVTTAAGALNNFVVDTVDQGQACIEYLRKQNIGRASFMVLEKLPKNPIDKLQTPENVARLFDLIKPKEPRFAPAFFKAVGNTLVAEDMTQANRIAYGQKRWRVVTLAGQLIDSSGTMSGGGNHASRGGMSSKFAADAVSPAVLKQYEQENDDAASKLQDAIQELSQVEVEIENLTRSGPQIDTSVQKLNLDLQNVSKRIAEAQKRVSDLRSKSDRDTGENSRISTLERDIASATDVLQELQEKTAKIEEAIAALEKKILDIGGAKLLAQKSKVDGVKLHINIANEEITKAEVAKQKAEKDSLKFAKSVESNKESLSEAEKEVEELRGQVEECVQYVTEIRSKVDDAKAAEDNSKEDLEKLKQELDEKTEQVRGFKRKEMELEQKLKTVEKEIEENSKALEHWRNEHDKLKLEEIDDDEEDEEAEDVGSRVEPQVKQESSQEVSKKQGNREGTPLHELHMYTVEELEKFKQPDLVADTALLDEKLKNAKPNLSVLKEYRKREEEFLKRAEDFETTSKLRDAQKQHYDSLRKQRLDEFMTGFNTISFKLKEMYQMITLGGNAELELVDSMDPFSEGIIFSVMPPKKSWRNISNLSGGEKTLSSLALVFALHAYKPTPLYFMDEIDAALDFRNVSIVANYIKDRTKNAQFIIISLRNDMFELSHRLIGIYKTANATKSVSIDNFSLNVVPVQTVPA